MSLGTQKQKRGRPHEYAPERSVCLLTEHFKYKAGSEMRAKMQNYRECSIEDFKNAMNLHRKMRSALEILDNYLERAIKDELNIVDVLDHIFTEEAKSKRQRAYEKQIQMSGSPSKRLWKSSISLSNPPSTSVRLTNSPPCDSWRMLKKSCFSGPLMSAKHTWPMHWGWLPLKIAIPPITSIAIR